MPRRRASRSSSSATVIFPIAQSEPTVSTIARRHLEVLAGRHVQIRRRPAQVAQLDAVLPRELDELGVGGEELVQAVLDVEPVRDARADQFAERRREAAAGGRDADERGGRLEAERVVDRADDREALLRLPRAPVSSIATTFSGA